MKTTLNDVNEEDRGIIAPCGIICLGCDIHQDESLDAARTVIKIWQGFNLPDVAGAFRLEAQQIYNALETLRKWVETREKAGPCPGCFKGGGPSAVCGIAKCVKSKGYWTCAECEDFDLQSKDPCPHSDTDSASTLQGSRREAWSMVCKRYSSNNLENLRKCREIGYPAFIAETREKVRNGWRTWQIISNEMVFTQR